MQKLKKNFFISVCSLFISALFLNAEAALYVLHPSQANLLNSKSLHIFMCGTGDPEPGMQALRKPACVAMIGDGKFYVFDAGEGAGQTLGALGLPLNKISAIFMTHWHSDHFGGLGQLINESWLSGNQQNITVYGPEGVKNILAGLKKAYRLDTEFRVKNRQGLVKAKYAYAIPKLVKATEKGKEVLATPDLKIYAFLVNHDPVKPAFGYRILYKNCKIVISGDTKIIPALAANAKNADLLINEAISHPLYEKQIALADKNQKKLQYAKETYAYHADSWQLAKMANTAGVKNLFITHTVPAVGTSEAMKKAFLQGMDKYYKKPIILTADRDEIVVTPKAHGICQVTYKPAPQPQVKVYPIPPKT